MKKLWLLLFLCACGSEKKTAFDCKTDMTVKQGLNSDWDINGNDRTFYADTPDVDRNQKVAVIFSFFGIYDSIENWREQFAPDPNGDPEFPFVHITFEDTGMLPPSGYSWDMFISRDGDDNREALLFEEVLGCLEKTYDIDEDRIFAMGFSGGAIVSNMLHSRYPDIVSTIVSESGAWFNDEAETESVDMPPVIDVEFDWDPLMTRAGTVLLTHGGEEDKHEKLGGSIDFEQAAQLAKPFLKDRGRTVIDCPHDLGHEMHPGLSTELIVKFFKNPELSSELSAINCAAF